MEILRLEIQTWLKKGETLRNHGLNQMTVRERQFFFGFCDMYFEKSVILDLGQNY